MGNMSGATQRRRSKKAGGIIKRQPSIGGLSNQDIYSLEFDGASKGNPGNAGAGAILKAPDGTVVCQLTKGVGIATCNFAEYQALIMGLKAALERGVYHIKAQGDSQLVCMQMTGDYKVRSPNILKPFSEAMKLKKKFQSFSMQHVQRKLNSAADSLANAAVGLPVDQLRCQSSTTFDGKDSPAKCKDISDCSINVSMPPQKKDKVYHINYHGAVDHKYAGAGVVLYSPDGTLHSTINQELGEATRNMAHYQALIIGLRTALDCRMSYIHIQGDSALVFKQMTGAMKINNERLQSLWKEANALLSSFSEFSIMHVDKSQNSEACDLAKVALRSPDGRINNDDTKPVGTSGTEHMSNVHVSETWKIQTWDTRDADVLRMKSPVETPMQSLSKAAPFFQVRTQSSALFRSHSHQSGGVPIAQAPLPLLKCLPLYTAKARVCKNVVQCPSKTGKIIPCIFQSSLMHIHSAGALYRPAFCSSLLQMCLKRSF